MPLTPSCTIDLKNNIYSDNCAKNAAFSFLLPPANSQTVLKINLDPNQGYEAVNFRVIYDKFIKPSGWTVNIGDSISNNGWGGDAGNQSNDAEVQVESNAVVIFGNDDTVGERMFDWTKNVVTAGSELEFTIRDQQVYWSTAKRTAPVPVCLSPAGCNKKIVTDTSTTEPGWPIEKIRNDAQIVTEGKVIQSAKIDAANVKVVLGRAEVILSELNHYRPSLINWRPN